jgi:2-polyprenyl-3-methyl-5-hydroxy-6-metoxy-1,4-benzoquinol methylase
MAYVADPKLTDPNESASTDERRGIASTSDSASGYWEWSFSGEAENHHYLVPGVLKALPRDRGERVLDIGCGNGALSAKIARSGFSVTGIDFTPSGIDRAKQSFPDVTFLPHDITLPLPEGLRNQFDIVVSCEVIEHLFLPRDLFARAREALGDSGVLLISTPFHGYWKNLAIALTNGFDKHWWPLSDYGHIKFFSERTLGNMAQDCGFQRLLFQRAGRIRPLAATMIMVAELNRNGPESSEPLR